ncbi:uncharacterized protein LOC135846073 [Planococcus citri]|uniref:uncharacterized protein LOC135846073 n=1 Tax=Planococcus citri TaxID=170843 RepID=UPI0031F8463A
MILHKYFLLFSMVFGALGIHLECEKWAFVHFFEGICKTLRMRGAILLDTVHALARDEITIYNCGRRTLSEIRRLQNLTTIQEKDELWIQDLYEYLVTSILNCDSCELWKGKYGGGGICTKIFLAVGGNMTDMINPEWIDHVIHTPRWMVVN